MHESCGVEIAPTQRTIASPLNFVPVASNTHETNRYEVLGIGASQPVDIDERLGNKDTRHAPAVLEMAQVTCVDASDSGCLSNMTIRVPDAPVQVTRQ